MSTYLTNISALRCQQHSKTGSNKYKDVTIPITLQKAPNFNLNAFKCLSVFSISFDLVCTHYNSVTGNKTLKLHLKRVKGLIYRI